MAMTTAKAAKPLSLTEIAKRISVHLHRFERDPEINTVHIQSGVRRFFCAGAYRGGRYVRVIYISYQGGSSLTREQAEHYLAWLDAGGIGRHHTALKEIRDRAGTSTTA